MPTSVEPSRASLRAPVEARDGVAERSLEPGLERQHRAAAPGSELAFDEGFLARGQVAVRRAWVVGNMPPADPKSEAAQPGDDCVIRAPQERGEHGGIEGGVQVELFVLVSSPARAGPDRLRCAWRCEPELACTARTPSGVRLSSRAV